MGEEKFIYSAEDFFFFKKIKKNVLDLITIIKIFKKMLKKLQNVWQSLSNSTSNFIGTPASKIFWCINKICINTEFFLDFLMWKDGCDKDIESTVLFIYNSYI